MMLNPNKRIFDILLPTTFHAIPGDLSRTATSKPLILNDVPKIIEIAINWGFTLNIEAILTAPVTNFSSIKNRKIIKQIKMLIIIFSIG